MRYLQGMENKSLLNFLNHFPTLNCCEASISLKQVNLKVRRIKPGTVAQVCSSRTGEAEAGGSLEPELENSHDNIVKLSECVWGREGVNS
jgi:hypothetical protein